MDQEDRIEIYTIPPNFAEKGTILSGRVKTRNAVETAMLLMVLVPLLFSLDTTVKIKMYIGMIVLVPMVVLSVIGIQGESLFTFIASFFRYLKRRRCLTEPDERYRLEQNRRKEKVQRGGKRAREKRKNAKREQSSAESRNEGEAKHRKTSKPGMEKEPKKDKKRFETGAKPEEKRPKAGEKIWKTRAGKKRK